MPKVDKSIVRFKKGREKDSKRLFKVMGVLAVLFGVGVYASVGGNMPHITWPQAGGKLGQNVTTFMQKQAVTPASQPSTALAASVGVVMDHVTLRQSPSLAGQTILVLEPGDEVELTAQNNGWVKAKWAMHQGWLPAESVFSKE